MIFAGVFHSGTAKNFDDLVSAWKKGKFLASFNAHAEREHGAAFARGSKTPDKKFVPQQELIFDANSFLYSELNYIRWTKTKLDIISALKEIAPIYSRKPLIAIGLHYTDAFHIASADTPASMLLKRNKFLPEVFFDGDLFFSTVTEKNGLILPGISSGRLVFKVEAEGSSTENTPHRFTLTTRAVFFFEQKNMTLQKFLADTKNEHNILQALHDYSKNIFASIIADDVLAMIGITPE
jgi:uncharacterized protein (TIGR04255 family)